ncbi:L,D-transpeptidase-like protein [Antricoccus suffuscus]|uniref:L,D-transpeptidase-like protein n=1 Tax=Antricoccus suffuscus TaxID=1629062 RepID=A0A2T0Z8R3_9ACTN|nr:L,D-transpeptidase [Antricoccus suffuscus]PRZ32737.1 L,D-transpeptidase-like protein [Antricoccus suffuscus]
MVTTIGPHAAHRLARSVIALALGAALLAGCSPATTKSTAQASSSATSEAAGSARSGPAKSTDAQASNAESPTPAEAPATTAQPPVTSYSADPSVAPVVNLGPPPAGYVTPRADCPTEAKACVDLTNNMTWLQVDGAVIFGPVQHIAGRPGYRTEPGMHKVFWKNIDHVSSIFGTPMPYAVFFTASGMAFHEGALSEPSHGCVHLTHDIALAYWNNLQSGDEVYVFGEAQY